MASLPYIPPKKSTPSPGLVLDGTLFQVNLHQGSYREVLSGEKFTIYGNCPFAKTNKGFALYNKGNTANRLEKTHTITIPTAFTMYGNISTLSQPTTYNPIFSFTDSSGARYGMYIISGLLRIYIENKRYHGSFAINDGQDHFAIVTWDGTNIKSYIDGVEKSASYNSIGGGGFSNNIIRFGKMIDNVACGQSLIKGSFGLLDHVASSDERDILYNDYQNLKPVLPNISGFVQPIAKMDMTDCEQWYDCKMENHDEVKTLTFDGTNQSLTTTIKPADILPGKPFELVFKRKTGIAGTYERYYSCADTVAISYFMLRQDKLNDNTSLLYGTGISSVAFPNSEFISAGCENDWCRLEMVNNGSSEFELTIYNHGTNEKVGTTRTVAIGTGLPDKYISLSCKDYDSSISEWYNTELSSITGKGETFNFGEEKSETVTGSLGTKFTIVNYADSMVGKSLYNYNLRVNDLSENNRHLPDYTVGIDPKPDRVNFTTAGIYNATAFTDAFPFTDDFTLAGRMRINEVTGTGRIIYGSSTWSNGFGIIFSSYLSGVSLRLQGGDGSIPANIGTTDAFVNNVLGQDFDYVFTNEKVGSTNNLKIYVNGVLRETHVTTGNYFATSGNYYATITHPTQGGSTAVWTGNHIQHVAFSRKWTDEEISSYHNQWIKPNLVENFENDGADEEIQMPQGWFNLDGDATGWKTVEDTEGERWVEFTADRAILHTSTQRLGTWIYQFNKSTTVGPLYLDYIASDYTVYDYETIQINDDGSINVVINSVNKLTKAAGYISTDTDYYLKMTKDSVGYHELYISGGSFGDGWTLVGYFTDVTIIDPTFFAIWGITGDKVCCMLQNSDIEE